MAASCCAATSTRCLVASSSSRARKSTLTMNPSLALNHSLASSSMRASLYGPSPALRFTPRSVALRRMSSDCLSSSRLPLEQLVCCNTPKKHTSTTALYLESPTRHFTDLESDTNFHGDTRKHISAVMAFALCFLASATTATSSPAGASGSSTSPKIQGGGMGPRKTKPKFPFSKLRAEEDVHKGQEEAKDNPYLVSEGIFQGARWTMEDTYSVRNGGRFVAVFDGHGGAEVSTILQERLYDLYADELVRKHWEQQNEFGARRKEVPSESSHIAALQRGLEQVEEAVLKLDDLVYQGSTAVCVILHVANDGRRTLLSANIGDSRATLCRGGRAVDLTRDHKPSDEREMERIRAMGEEVEWDPYGQVYRVRDLSLSRAVGDRFAKPVVTSEAEIMTFPVADSEDEFVVLASDGLWDVMTSQEVVDYIREIMHTKTEAYTQHDKRRNMAKIVANEALERGSADNVCVLVLWLKSHD